MTEAPVLSYPSVPAPALPTGPSIAELVAAWRALIDPIHKGDARFGPDIENGFADLAQLVDDFEHKHVVGKLAEYRVSEALGTVRRVRQVATRERGLAADEVRESRAGIAALSTVPPVADLVDGLIDQEVRGVIRALNAAKRAELLEEMRAGGQVRAMLAAARHPMPTDFEREAARFYAQFSEPAKRRNLGMRIEIFEAKKAAAQMLLDAADATKAIVARFVELEAALDVEAANAEAKLQASTITRPDAPRPPTTKGDAPAQWSRPTIQFEDNAGNATITRVD